MRNRVDGDGKTDIVNGCAAVGRIAVFGLVTPMTSPYRLNSAPPELPELIMETHRGKIWAESKNGYNIFYIQLPTNN